MKTIDKILAKVYKGKYCFNRVDRRYLQTQGIFNGVGAEKGINIGELILNNKKFLPFIDPEKIKKYVLDLEKCSQPHDAVYYEGNSFIKRVIADWKFSTAVFYLSHWAKPKNQTRLKFLIFFILLFKGGKAYNYGEKKDIYSLLPDHTDNEHKGYR